MNTIVLKETGLRPDLRPELYIAVEEGPDRLSLHFLSRRDLRQCALRPS
ncbi:MAG TPA: hypothetical protein VH253_07700 [Phycisphaerae bacterium]|nr:hypothetical protein [Phycisphaerae bacterium]